MYKFRKIIAIFLILNSVFIMGCGVKNDAKAEIQLWWYDHGMENTIDNNEKEVIYNTRAIIDRVKSYCDSNKIPLKMNVYTSSQISYENYILKRNVNLSKDNVIIMDNSSNLYELNENHCEYNKISNYKNIYNNFKNLSFIPLDMNIEMFAIDTELLEKYSVKLDKNVISYNEYLDVVNKMRTNGYVGGFLNTTLNLKKENLFSSSPKIKDENINIEKYKRVINECIKETQNISAQNNEILMYTTTYVEIFDPNLNKYIDDKSKNKKCVNIYRPVNTGNGREYCEDFNFNKYKVVLKPTGMDYCFFIGKNVTNNKVYDIGNLLMEQNTVFNLNNNFNIYEAENKFPTMKYDDIYKYLGFGQNGDCLFDNSYKENNDGMIYNESLKSQLNILYKEIYSGLFNDIKKEYYDSFQSNMPVNQYIKCSIYNISKKVIDNLETDLDSEINNMVTELKLKYK